MKYSSYSNELIDQVEKDNKLFNKTKGRLKPSDEVNAYEKSMKKSWIPFCTAVENSIKFKLTEGSFLVRNGENTIDFLKKFVDEVNLPYEKVVFEIDAFVACEAQNTPTLILLEQVDDLIYMRLALKNKDWVILEDCDSATKLIFDRKNFTLNSEVYTNNHIDDETLEKTKIFYHTAAFATFVSFICALSCKNTKIEDSPIQQSGVKNSLRKSKGKLPFFTHKILTIDPLSSNTKQPSKGGSHSSPRVHLRRGHIRRLATKNVWVNSCVVGDKSKGMVSKDYEIIIGDDHD